jgi:hypothetical protein
MWDSLIELLWPDTRRRLRRNALGTILAVPITIWVVLPAVTRNATRAAQRAATQIEMVLQEHLDRQLAGARHRDRRP